MCKILSSDQKIVIHIVILDYRRDFGRDTRAVAVLKEMIHSGMESKLESVIMLLYEKCS